MINDFVFVCSLCHTFYFAIFNLIGNMIIIINKNSLCNKKENVFYFYFYLI